MKNLCNYNLRLLIQVQFIFYGFDGFNSKVVSIQIMMKFENYLVQISHGYL